MKPLWFRCIIVKLFVIAVLSSSALAHTKGVSLSRFGLIDLSLQANVVYAGLSKVNVDKIGDRHDNGFNLTSFDVSVTGETFNSRRSSPSS